METVSGRGLHSLRWPRRALGVEKESTEAEEEPAIKQVGTLSEAGWEMRLRSRLSNTYGLNKRDNTNC